MSSREVKIFPSLKAFTGKLIDYAGLFPPASLDLTQAFHNYLFYQEGKYQWMLSKFICPAKRLKELNELMNHMRGDDAKHVELSIIGSGGDDEKSFIENLNKDIEEIISFRFEHEGKVVTDTYEVRVPKDVIIDKQKIEDLIFKVDEEFSNKLKVNVNAFYEASFAEDFNTSIAKLSEAISLHNNKKKSAGLKLRTGGVESSAFPASEEIAYTILKAKECNIPMKCTAGLHHPVRHYNESVSAKMHGFLNVFGAGILAYCHHLEYDEILEMLNEEDSYNFDFDEDGFLWKDFIASTDEIQKARKEFMISYGSCSFDEPIDDLKTLELL